MPLTLPTHPDAVLLDLDGTLSASGPVIVAGIRRALATLGVPPMTEAELQGWLGPPLVDSFAALPGFDAARAAEGVALYRATYDPLEAPLFDGVPEALAALRAAGLRLALATSKPQAYAEQILAGHGLAESFEAVVGWDDTAGRRTKGDCVGEALRRLRGPGAPVMVGDRVHDVEGAAEHGVPCVGVLWGYAAPGELSGASAVVATLEELTALLTGR